MSLWGVGPTIVAPVMAYGLAALAATLFWPDVFSLTFLPYPWLAVVGGALLAGSAVWYALAARAVWRAYHQRRLVTGGLYAVCRHPIYAGWVLFILPGLGLLADSWLVLSTALVMYVLTRLYAPREEAGLEAQFGEEYVEYKRRTNAVFPAIGSCVREKDGKREKRE
jgi:protein-S-isoprenylcysteine O-methyltransferase Ste14